MNKFIPGQRWISKTEPELGLGTIVKQEAFQVSVLFTASGIMRTYTRQNAPLQRVVYQLGDILTIHNGKNFTITSVEENQGLITYFANKEKIGMCFLRSARSFSSYNSLPEVRRRNTCYAFEEARERVDVVEAGLHGYG